MATSKSAEKRVRQNEKKRERNKKYKTRIHSTREELLEAVEAGEDEETIEELKREAISCIDKAVSKGAIHKNKAARLKSRLEAKINQ